MEERGGKEGLHQGFKQCSTYLVVVSVVCCWQSGVYRVIYTFRFLLLWQRRLYRVIYRHSQQIYRHRVLVHVMNKFLQADTMFKT